MKLISFILSFNLLVASTGVPVFTHICKASEIGTVSVLENDLTDQRKDASCCGPKKCGQPSDSDQEDCCETNTDWYKQDIDALIVLHESYSAKMPVMVLSLAGRSAIAEVFPIKIHPADRSEPVIPAQGISPPALQVFRC